MMVQNLTLGSVFFTVVSVVALIAHLVWPGHGLSSYAAGLAAVAALLWIITGCVLMSEPEE